MLTFNAHLEWVQPAGANTIAGKTYAVCVTACMRNPDVGPSSDVVTNTFHFTFYSDVPQRTPRLFPRTYADAMLYIEATRRAERGAAAAAQRAAAGPVRTRFPEAEISAALATTVPAITAQPAE